LPSGSASAWWPPVATRASTPTARLGRRIGARAIDALISLVLAAVPLLVIDADRILARLVAGVVVVGAFEAAFVTSMGATPGKLIAGVRVQELDQPKVTPTTAVARGLLTGFCTLVVFAAPAAGVAGSLVAVLVVLVLAVLAVSTYASPLRRGFVDRLAGTFVVDRDAPALIATLDLAQFSAVERPPAVTPWGPVATFDQRRRARASRLDNAPVLVLGVLAVAFGGSVQGVSGPLLAGLAALWVGLFIADETWRVSRYGGTAGHLGRGLAVVDVDSGEAPSPGRSMVRASLVACPLYVLPGAMLVTLTLSADDAAYLFVTAVTATLVLGWLIWARVSPEGRSLHDLAARTVVVAPSSLHPRNDRG